MTLWLWLIFGILAAVLVSIDVGLTTRRPRIVTPIEALASFTLWLLATAAFAVGIYYVYQYNFLDIEKAIAFPIDRKSVDLDGQAAVLQYFGAYVLEMSLSIDNIAVLGLLLAYYKVPRPVLGRALFWSIFLTLALRLLAVLTCAWFVREWPWFKWVLGGILIVAVLRVLVLPDQNTRFDERWYVRLVRRVIPLSSRFDGQHLFVREPDASGRMRLKATPIVLVVCVAGFLDVAFAADSVPAIFSITKDPMLAFTGSAMAILSLRSLFLALAEHVGRFRYLRVSVALVLLYVAGKMFLGIYQTHDTFISLAVILGIMTLGVTGSLLHTLILRRRAQRAAAMVQVDARPTPLEDLGEAVDVTRRNLRKIVVLILGTLMILVLAPVVGMLPGPGGLLIVAAGLGVLATEFIWARRLLTQIKAKTQKMADSTDSLAGKTPIWVVPLVVVGFIVGVIAAAWFAPYTVPATEWVIKRGLVLAMSTGPAVAIGYWAWRTVSVWWNARRGKSPRVDPKPRSSQHTS